jgi:thiol-disulfide isomerase/thioredoxin
MIRYRNDFSAAMTFAVLFLVLPHAVFAQAPQAMPTSPVQAAADSSAESNDKDMLRTIEQVRDDVRALRHEVDNLRALLESARGKSGSDALPDRIALAATKPQEPLLSSGIYFFNSEWCGPCQKMRPLIDQLKREGLPIVDVDVDRRRDLRHEFHIDTIPVFVLMIGGKEQERATGMQEEERLRGLLAKIPHSPPTSGPSKPGLKAKSAAKTDPKTEPWDDAAAYQADTAPHDSPRGAGRGWQNSRIRVACLSRGRSCGPSAGQAAGRKREREFREADRTDDRHH